MNSKVSVRRAEAKDFPEVFLLIKRWYKESEYPDQLHLKWDDSVIMHTLVQGISGSLMILVVEESGSIVGTAVFSFVPWIAEPKQVLLNPITLYVLPSYRSLFLFRTLSQFTEQEAKKLGLHAVIATASAFTRPEAMGSLFKRRGYKPLQHSYWKEV